MNIKTSRKLIKFGNYSLCITLPKSLVRDLKLKKGDIITLDVDPSGKSIKINLDSKTSKKVNEPINVKADIEENIVLDKVSRW